MSETARSRAKNSVGIRILVAALLAAWFCSGALSRAHALPQFPAVVTAAYSLKADSAVVKAQCQICHVAAGPPKLNLYGTDVRAALKQANTKTLTPDILHTLDSRDSDSDGVSNLDEFKAGTLPGDPNSKPAGAVAPTKAVSQPAAEPEPGLFDPRTLLFPKHAQHRVLVHFPIGLFVMSLLFDVLALWKRNSSLAVAGYYNLIAAAISSILALITGILAWRIAYAGVTLTGILLYHLILACVTSVLMFVMWRLRSRQKPADGRTVTLAYLAVGLLAFLLISLTGHLGGALVTGG